MSPGNASARLLTAFFDFELSAYDFGIVDFLAGAEVVRRHRACAGIRIVFVPEAGRAVDGDLHAREALAWRLHNILVPACRLLPTCLGVVVCADRAEAQDVHARSTDVFPEGYAVERPVDWFGSPWLHLYALRGEDVQPLRASPQARAYVDRWLSERHPGQKVVAITLRSAPYNPQRNSDPKVWGPFAHRLAQHGFAPVIVPDTETALLPLDPAFDGLSSLPAAAFNVELRMALYEAAYANAVTSNGAGTLCDFSRRTRFIHYRSGEWFAQPYLHERAAGVKAGRMRAHYSRFQRFARGTHEPEFLWREFRALADDIERAGEPPGEHPALQPDPANREPLGEFAGRLLRYRQWDILDATLEHMRQDGGDEVLVAYLSSVAALERGAAGSSAAAGLETVVRSISADSDRGWEARSAAMLVDALVRLDRLSEAEAWLTAHLAAGTAGPEARGLLGSVLERLGRHGEAEANYRAAVGGGAANGNVLRGLAQAVEARGALDEATQFYRAAIDHEDVPPQCYERLGLILEASTQLDAAVEVYRAAAARGVATFACYYRLAMLLKDRGELREALRVLEFLVARGLQHPRIQGPLQELRAAVARI